MNERQPIDCPYCGEHPLTPGGKALWQCFTFNTKVNGGMFVRSEVCRRLERERDEKRIKRDA